MDTYLRHFSTQPLTTQPPTELSKLTMPVVTELPAAPQDDESKSPNYPF
jgi:hypothetical protein